MISNIFKYLAITIGLTSVFISMVYGNQDTLYVKPVFHIFLFIFFYTKTKKINWLLVLFLLSAMIGEAFMSQGLENNYGGVMVLFSIVFLSGILLLRPVLIRTKFNNEFKDVVIPIIIGFGIVYALTTIYAIAIEFIPDLIFYSVTILLFIVYIACCFYIAFVNKHPKNTFLFIVGTCYSLVVVGAFAYELVLPYSVVIGGVNLLEIIAQFYFVLYIAYIAEVAEEKNWFI